MGSIRRPGAASAAVLVGLCVALAAAHLLAPDWSRGAGLDVWNYAALEEHRRAAVEARQEMNATAERAARRRAVADQLAVRLAAGELPLDAVAGDLLALYSTDPAARCGMETYRRPGEDLHLVYARHAVSRADRLLAADPARQTAVHERLQAEYRVLEAGRAPR